MVSSAAKTAQDYLDSLPPERRQVIATLRELILRNLPPGYEETMNWGMLCYEIPLARYPNTYNGQPLGSVALAAQKNAYSLYLCLYMYGEKSAARFREAFARAGKKLDMGKSCVRFKKLEDLALDVIADQIASISVDEHIRQYEKVRAATAVGIRPARSKTATGAAGEKKKLGKGKESAAAKPARRAAAGAAGRRKKLGKGKGR